MDKRYYLVWKLVNCRLDRNTNDEMNIIFIEFPDDKSLPYPIIDDEKRELAVKFQMLDKDEIGKSGLPLTCRAVFIIDNKKKLRAKILYPATTGRNFEYVSFMFSKDFLLTNFLNDLVKFYE